MSTKRSNPRLIGGCAEEAQTKIKNMKKLLKKILYYTPSSMVITALVMGMFANWLQVAQATVYVNQSDTMTRLQNSTAADHTVAFTLPSTITFDISTNVDTLRVDFDHTGGAAAFTQSGTWQTTDFAMTVNNGGQALTINAVDQSAAPNVDCTVADGAWNVCIAVETDTHVFTIKPSSNFTGSTADQEITFTILGASGGTGALTNPVTNGSYKTDLAMCDEDAGPCTTTFTSTHSGALAVSIIADEQVVVSAVVDPTITFTITGDPVALGTLSTASISTDTLTAQTETNAVNGYSVTLISDGALRNGANTINAVADGAVTIGSEEYGVATNDDEAGLDISYEAGCDGDPSTGISAVTAQTFGGESTGPVNEIVTLCFAASIDSQTLAATYQHTLTLISTGLF